MKKKGNSREIVIGIIISGIASVFFIVYKIFSWTWPIIESIACSIFGAGIMLIISGIFINAKNVFPVWDEWKMERIFRTRVQKNEESDPKLEKHSIKQLDAIAFGLTSFRANHKQDMQNCLNHGMNARILVMNPNGKYINDREAEEDGKVSGHMANSIKQLVGWVDDLNRHSTNGKIEIRFYNCMTLDFYWRIDDELYFGPYMYGKPSQQTITYKFVKGGKGFDVYSDYFEELWNSDNGNITVP